MKWHRPAVLAALILAPGSAWADNGWRRLVQDVSEAARRRGLRRLAVLPMEPADGGSALEGRSLAEGLLVRLVGEKIAVVERSGLREIMRERALAQTGAVRAPEIERSVIAGADGVLAGSFTASGGRVLVRLRLIETASGLVVAATEGSLPRDWPGASEELRDALASAWDPWRLPAPEFSVEPPPLPDGPAQPDACEGAARRVDALEERILDLKARYWAERLKNGLDLARLKFNPGSSISDPSLRQEFYGRLAYWHARSAVPPMNQEEVRRFILLDGRAFELSRECGLQ